MKIGYLLEQGVETRKRPFSGPANHIRHVMLALQQRGHQVRLLNRLDGQIYRSDDLENYTPVHVPGIDDGPFRRLESAVRRIQSTLRLPYVGYFEANRFAHAARQEMAGFDLLYQRNSWMGYGGGLAAQRLGIPLILEDNGDHLNDLEARGQAPTGLHRRLALALMRRGMARATHVISSGEGWRRAFIQRWAYDPARVTTIENGTELVHLLPRQALYHFQDAPARETATLVYVGGFYPWHGIPVLLPALAHALAQGARARLLLIGSGDGLAEAQQMVAALGLDAAVTFAGHLRAEQYAPLLAQADIGVSPYCGWPEFSGLKILDYKAAGLPTIASGQEGQPPTLCHEETGLIVPPCDGAALQTAIVRLCADAPLRRRLGQTARLEAEQQHTWQHTVDRIEQVMLAAVREIRD